MTANAWIRRGLATLALPLLLTGCPPPRDAASAQPARPAPDFALQDVNGKTVRLSDSAGRVRLVDFWATWCAPCRAAIPHFKELDHDYGDKGLTILAISMDDDAKKVLPPFLEEWKIPYTTLIGNDDVAEAFGGVSGLPTAFLVDRDGQIVDTFFGGVPKAVLETKIRAMLGRAPTG